MMATRATETSIASVASLGLLGLAAWRVPEAASHGGSRALTLSSIGLVAYMAAALCARRAHAVPLVTALDRGAWAGLALAAVAMTNHSLEMFAALRAPLPAILGVGMWGLMFSCYGAVSSAVYRDTGAVGLGVVGAVWAALVSTAAVILFAVALGLVFMPHMQNVFAARFVESGFADSRAFVVRTLFDSASQHLLAAPIVAAAVGAASTLVCVILRPLRRGTLVGLAFVGLGVFAAGVTSLRYASSLDRPARPPFVLSGLLGLGTSLCSAFPLAAAITRASTGSRSSIRT